jgi:hypothetical protein
VMSWKQKVCGISCLGGSLSKKPKMFAIGYFAPKLRLPAAGRRNAGHLLLIQPFGQKRNA